MIVKKVGFYGDTGDDRSPESLPFPACMTSLMETLGNGGNVVTIQAHDTEYTKRCDNDKYLAASGMAFGLLWEKSFCMSAMDLTQVTPLDETIRRTFAFAGYSCEILSPTDDQRGGLSDKVKASVGRGAPVLGFGLFDPPECAIIAGYDGDAILGWSHFQRNAQLPCDDNGMFRLKDWEKDCWTLVFPGEKCAQTLTYREALKHGVDIMALRSAEGYLAGQAAYEEWIAKIEASGSLADEDMAALYDYHHNILFSLAELRCWGANFLREAGVDKAADAFKAIHDTCWKIDAAAGAENHIALRDAKKRREIAALLEEIRALDETAEREIREFLSA